MPRDGSSGAYTRAASAYVANTVISETSVNAEMDDLATEMTNSVAKDGQTTMSGNLPMGGFKATGVGNASARTEYPATGQVQDGATVWGGTAGGTADALTITLAPAITAYAAGQSFRFIAAADNTGAATLNVNGVGAQSIRHRNTALIAGQIKSGQTYVAIYDGTNFQLGNAAKTIDGVLVGALQHYGGTATPSGWLLCYGQAVSRTTYADLFAAYSTTYGVGDGSTTFNLPDGRGRVLAGQDDMGGVSANRLTGQTGGVDGDTLGGVGGAETHTLTEAQLPAVTPTTSSISLTAAAQTITTQVRTDISAGGSLTVSVAPPSNTTQTTAINAAAASAVTGSITMNAIGSGNAHNNVQPTLIVNLLVFAGV